MKKSMMILGGAALAGTLGLATAPANAWWGNDYYSPWGWGGPWHGYGYPGYWGGYPGYGWGGYPGYGWGGYPGYGWGGYPGYGWGGYPGYWGGGYPWGWGGYPAVVAPVQPQTQAPAAGTEK
jgi:hypothetical protein